MYSKPLVSVVMPAYNHEQFVGEAIESVLNQTFEEFEFIIINDGSTDRTEEVITGYSDKRIRYFPQENADAPYTINRGISLAKGRYISIINSDDIYHKDRLSFLVDTAEKEALKFLITDVAFIDHSSEHLPDTAGIVSWHRKVKKLFRQHGSLYRAFLRSNMAVSTSNFFFDASITDETGKFRERLRYLHDYDFIYRVVCRFGDRFRFADDRKYLYYRLHGNNTIHKSFYRRTAEDIFVHLVNLYRYLLTTIQKG